MMKWIGAILALLLCAPALADQAPETPLVAGPNFQQVPASQILIHVPGGSIITLGAALAAGGCTTNCNFSTPTITGGSISGAAVAATTLSATGAVNTTGASGYQITGLPAMNLLANQASPIVSPETANSPTPGAVYFPQPLVVGYNATAGVFTYESMVTSNLTIPGTVTAHYGQLEYTINLLGTGTMSGELNNQKNYVLVPSGLTLGTGENFEAQIENKGTTNSWSALLAAPANDSTGTMGTAIGVNMLPSNANATGGSFSTFIGVNCNPQGGGGSAISVIQCIFNQDPKSEITNAGHYGARPGSTQPILTACGTSPTLSSRGGDAMGTITEGATATGCTVTFAVPYQFAAPQCVVSSPNGAPLTGYTMTNTTLTITNASASGNQYTYMCMAVF